MANSREDRLKLMWCYVVAVRLQCRLCLPGASQSQPAHVKKLQWNPAPNEFSVGSKGYLAADWKRMGKPRSVEILQLSVQFILTAQGLLS